MSSLTISLIFSSIAGLFFPLAHPIGWPSGQVFNSRRYRVDVHTGNLRHPFCAASFQRYVPMLFVEPTQQNIHAMVVLFSAWGCRKSSDGWPSLWLCVYAKSRLTITNDVSYSWPRYSLEGGRSSSPFINLRASSSVNVFPSMAVVANAPLARKTGASVPQHWAVEERRQPAHILLALLPIESIAYNLPDTIPAGNSSTGASLEILVFRPYGLFHFRAAPELINWGKLCILRTSDKKH